MASNTEKRITAKMVLDSTGYNDKLKGLNAEMKKHQAELKFASQGIKSFGKDSEKLKSVQEALSKQVELHSKKVDIYSKAIEKTKTKLDDNIKVRDKLKKSLDDANKKYEQAVKVYGKESEQAKKAKEEVDRLKQEHEKASKAVETNAKQVQNYETNMNKANAEMVKIQGELKKVNGELEKSNNKWLKAGESLKKSSEKLKNIGGGMEKAGEGILKIIAPLAAGGIASLKFATNFEDSIAKVSTIADTTQVPIGDLRKGILKLSNDTGIASTEIANNVYDAISAGQKTGDAINFVRNSTKLAKAGFAEAGQSLDVLTTIMNAYKMKAQDVTKVSDYLITTQNEGKVTVGELSSVMGKVIPTAVATNTSLKQVTAGYALMTKNGIKAAESTTYMNGMLNEMSKTGSTADKAIKAVSGKSFPELMKSGKSVSDVLNMMNDYAKKNNLSLKDLFGNAEAGKAALVLSTNAGTDFNEMLGKMEQSAGATDRAFGKVTNTAGERFKKSLNKIKNEAIRLGDAIAPMMDRLSELMSKLSDKLSGLSNEQLKNIAKWGSMSIATGSFLKVGGKAVSGIGSLVGGIGQATEWIGKLSGATKVAESVAGGASVATAGVTKGISAMGLATKAGTLLLNPWVLGIGAATVAGIALYKHLKKDATPSVDLFADKVSKSNTAMMNYSAVSKSVETSNVKISKSTKQAVGAYMDLDKKASKSMLNLVANSNKFSKQTKDKVLKNFTDMSKKSSSLSNEQKNAMTINFKKLVTDTGVLTKRNKDEIIKQYTAMVNGTKGLTKRQKDQTIKEFTDTLNKSTAITKQQSDNLQKIYKDMGDKIKIGLDKKKAEELQSQQDFFSKSNVLTTTEEAKILQTTATSWENKKKTIDGLQNQINSIIKNAADNHRQITTEEAKTIDGLQKKMKENAVKTLSASEVEQKVIMERLKSYNGRITAEQASEVIKNAEKQRQGTVDKANKQYDGTVRNIIKLRDESKVISAATADKMIKEAERQRKETINKANDQKKQVVSKVKGMNSDIGKSVNTTTGDILSKWDKLKSWWSNWHPDAKQFNYTLRGIETKGVQKKWTGDRYFSGGLTYLHDAPGHNSNYELYDLPRGTRIFNHDASADLVMKTAENVATKVANSLLSGFKGTNGVNVTQNIYAPVPTPSEMARQSKNNLRELALQW
ncbi:phage tail tape measure protein, TP901 family, core region [Clostridium botulinum CDC_297]|nr:phage tail tape measure protein, TP901 family, core region [Clostridium botulinum CDC_297]